MPVRGLLGFLQERNLVKKDELSVLKDTRIGIDANQWLRKCPREPLLAALGGIPLSADAHMTADLEQFKHASIRPLFVFSGINMPRKERPFGHPDQKLVAKATAWEEYARGAVDKATATFSGLNTNVSPDLVNHVFSFLQRKNVEVFRAPYLAWAQLAWLTKQNFLHAVCGGAELLMFNIPRIIVDIDFTRNTFDWVDSKTVFESLGLTHEMFLDACVLAGFELISTFPVIQDPKTFTFGAALSHVAKFGSGFNSIQYHLSLMQQNAPTPLHSYLDSFIRSKMLIRHHLILEPGCECIPLAADGCPADLHEMTGPRLPNEAYFLLSQGCISTQVLSTLVTGLLVEYAPLVDTDEYRRVLDSLQDLRSKAIGIVSNCLNEFYQQKKINIIRWFDPQADIELPHQYVPGLRWSIRDELLSRELTKQGLKDVDLHMCLTWHAAECEAATVTSNLLAPSRDSRVVVRSDKELTALVLFEFLEARDYIGPEGDLMIFGKALQQASSHTDEILLVLELMKIGQLTGTAYSTAPGGPAMTPAPVLDKFASHEQSILLLSRIFSLLPMRLRARQWDAAVDYDLAGFHSIVKTLQRSLRNLLDMIFLSVFLKQKAQLSTTNCTAVANRLPLSTEPNTAMGIVVKRILQTPEHAVKPDLYDEFPCCLDPWGDIKVGIEFWTQVMQMATFMHSIGSLPRDFYDMFDRADSYLQSKRYQFEV
eukprot:GILJ01005317.1.p1 GENE.GILJ01005317.1~~GILJ01005317.1.p1  ORF type:complete len:710 (-),score=120.16 GILJ01005317.1:212-2341(-)